MDSSSSTSSSTSSHNHSHQPQQQSPRPLQGPRPAPLKVRKESYKIKKPPVAPHHHHPSGSGPSQHQAAAYQQQQQQQLPRQPVIIYTVSPKVIHTKPGDFMSLVQRLTGVNSSPTAAAAAAAESQPSPGAFPSPGPAGALSPAAKLATIEKVHQQSAAEYHHHPYRSSSSLGGGDLDSIIEQFESSSSAAATAVLDYRTGNNNLPFPPPAILSPNPASLPAISPSFFASGGDLNSLGFLQDFLNGLSPMAGAAATATAITTTAPAIPVLSTAAASVAPVTSRGGFIDSSFLLSPPASGSQLAFASALLAPSPGGFWDRPSGLGFTPTAGAPSPNWDLFGSFPDL